MDDNQAKRGLISAVEGAQSRLEIAGMDPDCQAMRDISFGEYLQRMGEKFRPAAESIQMKEEYLNRTQRAEEDVQSYVSEKTELFRAAFPHASQREWSRCWMETAEGLCNQYVRDRMMASESRDTEDFVRQAVRAVQAEQARIRIGDSTEGREGLESVSRRIGAGEGEKARWGSQRRSPAGEEREGPQRERSVRRKPPAREVHELRWARQESEEAPSPPVADAPRGGCKVQKMGLTHRLAATVIKFGELKNRIKDSYAVAVSLKQKAYM